MIFIVVILISYHYAGTIKDDRNEKLICDSIHLNNKFLYITYTTADGNGKYDLMTLDSPAKLKGNIFVYYDYSGGNVLLWILFGVSIFLILFPTLFGDDEDIGWDINKSRDNALSSLIECEEENGKFYYTVQGRLLGISTIDNGKSPSWRKPNREFGLKRFRDLHLFPKFETKTRKRETLLTRLGI
jgi:hypothetical protein